MDKMTSPPVAELKTPELLEEKKESSKPFSLRLGEDSVQTFREWCDNQGLSQADGFSNLIKMLELQKSKEMIPNRQTEVEHFQSLLTSLADSFLHSLELNESAEIRIRQTLQMQLESKDKTIADYQEKLATEKEYSKSLLKMLDELDDIEKDFEDLKNDFQNLEHQIKDKDNIISMLNEKLDKTESTEEELVALKKEVEEKNDEITELEKQLEVEKANCQTEKIKAAQAEKDVWNEKLQQERNALQAEKDALKDKLQADLHAAIDAAQDKARANEDKLRDKIAKLEKEAGRQEKELELLRADNDKKTLTIERITGNYNALRDEYKDYKKAHPTVETKE